MLKYKILVSILALAIVSACGSTEKNANKKLEDGDYESAVTLFEKVVQNEPNNLEAAAGLKRAREGVIDRRLIDVRKSRQSGSAELALDQLLMTVEKEKEWRVFPASAAKYTQDEETGYAWKTYQAKVMSAVQSKYALKAETEWKRYLPVFSDPKFTKGIQSLKDSVYSAGKSQCSQLVREAKGNYPYYSSFVSRFCRHYKSPTRVSVNENARLSELYSGVDFSGSIQGLPPEYFGYFKTSWNDALKESVWFDPKGKKRLKVNVGGNYKFDHQKVLVTRVHEYKMNENYDVVEIVTKTRETPVTTMRWETDPKDGVLKQKPFTEIKTETYSEPVHVTKTREVQKQFPYSALHHQIQVDLSRNFEANLGERSFSLTHQTQGSAQGDEQSLNKEDIGLKPSKAPMLDTAEWVKKDATDLSAQVRTSLAKEWELLNCAAPVSALSVGALGNYAIRCARDPSYASSSIVNEWYKNTVGLTTQETEAILAEK